MTFSAVFNCDSYCVTYFRLIFALGMGGGLLHNLPTNVPQAEDIYKLANQCARPLPSQDRFFIKDKLISHLEAVVKKSEAGGGRTR